MRLILLLLKINRPKTWKKYWLNNKWEKEGESKQWKKLHYYWCACSLLLLFLSQIQTTSPLKFTIFQHIHIVYIYIHMNEKWKTSEDKKINGIKQKKKTIVIKKRKRRDEKT